MILDTIAEAARKRVALSKEQLPLEQLKVLLYEEGSLKSFSHREVFAFEQALKKAAKEGRLSFICEVKKASPSKGVISEEFPYLEIAREYEAAGADAISVLTEPDFFQGNDEYLKEISKEAEIPILRKDFTIDEYQIYEAKLIGADAVLLICSLLDTKQLKVYLTICEELGLSALVEAHTKEELQSALEAGARIIGVNNRNLKTFEVDIQNCIQLKPMVPREIIFVAESGIRTLEDIHTLVKAEVNAVLIGETLMRSKDKQEMLASFKGA